MGIGEYAGKGDCVRTCFSRLIIAPLASASDYSLLNKFNRRGDKCSCHAPSWL